MPMRLESTEFPFPHQVLIDPDRLSLYNLHGYYASLVQRLQPQQLLPIPHFTVIWGKAPLWGNRAANKRNGEARPEWHKSMALMGSIPPCGEWSRLLRGSQLRTNGQPVGEPASHAQVRTGRRWCKTFSLNLLGPKRKWGSVGWLGNPLCRHITAVTVQQTQLSPNSSPEKVPAIVSFLGVL